MNVDRDKKRFLLAVLPKLVEPPPNTTDYMDLLAYQTALLVTPPDPLLSVHQRLFGGDNNVYEGRDVFSDLAKNRLQFYCLTGETPETVLELAAQLHVHESSQQRLSILNRVLMFVLWLRQYPTFSFLASSFEISITSVHEEISKLLPLFEAVLYPFIIWPSLDDWRLRRGLWELEPLVGAIDGTSHEVNRPMTEPQEQYFSGHRRYHCIHTQIIVDNGGAICFVESGFVGHLNDAQQFNLMTDIGGPLLPFPNDCVLIGDKIYPNRFPIVTQYTRAQINIHDANLRRKQLRYNRILNECRVIVEHTIGQLKGYKAVACVWRHQRQILSRIVKICSGFVNRRKSRNLIY